jgi:aminopeptidase N
MTTTSLESSQELAKPSQAKYRADYQPCNFTIKNTTLAFYLNDSKTKVHSKLDMTVMSDKGDLVLDANVQEVLTVKVNGVELNANDYVYENELLVVSRTTLSRCVNELAVGTSFLFESQVSLDPANNLALEGLYKTNGAYCTQCEAEGFRKITPYLDRPDVLSVFTVSISADAKTFPHLLSNGNLIEDVLSEDDGLKTVVWHDPFPKPSYLFALVAGDFDVLTDTYVTADNKEVLLEIYVDKGNLEYCEHAMVSLQKSMAWDEEKYGLIYDLERYMIVAVDFFNMGAMENKGLNVFNSKYVLANDKTATDVDFHGVEAVIGHEYFHNWTGNRVTCRDWFQLSLKEGLTVFRDQQFSADMGSPIIERISHARVMRTMQFAEDAGPMKHPIRPDKVVEMNNFYTVTVYDKGAEVIRMFNTLLGETGFRKGIDLYFERHDGQAVTCDDFVDAMADANSVDLSKFRRWYSQAGTPVVTVKESHSDEMVKLQYSQNINGTDGEYEALTIPVKYEVLCQESGLSLQRGLFTFDQHTKTQEIQIDRPVVVVLFEDFSAPVKVERELGLESVRHIIAHASDPFCRWDSLQTLWQLALNEVDGDRYVKALIDTIKEVVIDDSMEASIQAELIAIPSFQLLADTMPVIDVERILTIQNFVASTLAKDLEKIIIQKLSHLSDLDNDYEKGLVAKRNLKSKLMYLLGFIKTGEVSELFRKEFGNANNMTEKMSIITATVNAHTDVTFELVENLKEDFSDNVLVFDKILNTISTIDSKDVYTFMDRYANEDLFDKTNPNRLRALYGSFIMRNPARFHAKDGTGYQFLANKLMEFDKINPQLAARLVDPLLSYKKYSDELGSKMFAQIKFLAKQVLSKDLNEKIQSVLLSN